MADTTLSSERRYLEAEETFLQSHRLEEFVGIKWKPAKLSKTGSSKVAVGQHRSDLRRTEYRAIRKVSKMEQQEFPIFANPYTIIRTYQNKQVKYPPSTLPKSHHSGRDNKVRTDGTQQNPLIRRSQTTKEIYNRAKEFLQAM